jgi:predicted transcriptional regulator
MRPSRESGRIEQAVQIVAAYVARNHVPRAEVSGLIDVVFSALSIDPAADPPAAEASAPVPAVPIKKSITPDFIICLEDGKSFKSMKRHLAAHFDLTPDQYRRKWNLPSDYPMVAASYAAKRSALAIRLGLGRPSNAADEAAEIKPPEAPKRRAPRKAKADVKVSA